jgi:hypothetical protein
MTKRYVTESRTWHSAEVFDLPADAWEGIERDAGLVFGEQCRLELSRAVSALSYTIQEAKGSVRVKAMRASLSKIKKAAATIAAELTPMVTPPGVPDTYAIWLWLVAERGAVPIPNGGDVEQLHIDMMDLAAGCETALTALPTQATPNSGLHRFVLDVERILKSAGIKPTFGWSEYKSAYTGTLHSACVALYRRLPDALRTCSDLGPEIKRARRHRGKPEPG